MNTLHHTPYTLHSEIYPFGSGMSGRSFSGYRYGFNGQEKDDEIAGNGNSLDFGARIYNSRLGRWLSVDPLVKSYCSVSGYQFAQNNPIIRIDITGKADYYFNGKWIGSNGVEDNNIVIIKDKELKQKIISSTEENKPYDLGKLKNGIKTENYYVLNRDILAASYDVLQKAKKEVDEIEYLAGLIQRGDHFEKVFSGSGGTKYIGEDGETYISGGHLPGKLDVSIHSHPLILTVEQTENNKVHEYAASMPSPGLDHDVGSFQNYQMNIIVGAEKQIGKFDLEKNNYGKWEALDYRTRGIFIFNSNSDLMQKIDDSEAEKILNNRINEKKRETFKNATNE